MSGSASSLPTYLDYNATTPVDRRVAEAIWKAAAGDDAPRAAATTTSGGVASEFSSPFANPSSLHAYSKGPKELLATARGQAAALLGCDESEVVFESGGTESINHCLKAPIIEAWRRSRKEAGLPLPHLITTAVEHVAVLETCKFLEEHGFCTVTRVPVDTDGVVSPADIAAAVVPGRTVVVSVMLANNETGAVQPVKAIVDAVKAKDSTVLVHTDASQCLGKLSFSVRDLGVDLLSVAGHKLYAPKGVGLTFVRAEVDKEKRLPVFVHGAGQENGRRAGTENLLLIAGLGKACELCTADGGSDGAGGGLAPSQVQHSLALRDRLASNLLRLWEERVLPTLPASEDEWPFASRRPVIHGPLKKRIEGSSDAAVISSLPNTLSIAFPGCFAAKMVILLADTVAVSAGAACHAHAPGDPKQASVSHVLAAMGVPKTTALCTLRLSVGRWSNEEEIDRASALIIDAVLTALKHRSHTGLKDMAAEERKAMKPAMATAPALPLFKPTAALYLEDTHRFYCDAASVVASLPVQITTAKGSSSATGPGKEMSPLATAFSTDDGDSITVSGPAVPLPKIIDLAALSLSSAGESESGTPSCLAVLLLDQTVAHPQGGGQPSDRGVIALGRTGNDADFLFFVFHAVRKATLTASSSAPAAAGYRGEAVLHYGYYASPSASALSLADAAAATALPSSSSAAETVEEDGSSSSFVAAPAPRASDLAGHLCGVFINAPHRRMSARLHSAGHLLDLAVRRVIDTLIAAEAAASSSPDSPAAAAPSATAAPGGAGAAGGKKGGKGAASPEAEGPLKQLVPGKGYHFSDGSFVEYEGSIPSRYLADNAFSKLVEQACGELLGQDAATVVRHFTVGSTTSADDEALAAAGMSDESVSHLPKGSLLRIVSVGGQTNTCPCGGTHVKRAGEIGSALVVTKVTSKKGKTKVNYTLKP